MTFTIRELDASTWSAFAELVERNNGILGAAGGASAITPNADRKGSAIAPSRKTACGRAHAALVIDEEGAVDQGS